MNFPTKLLNKIWHTTSIERYQQILDYGYISPNPPVPDSERWKTSSGPSCFPYVRTLGGISLFDFTNFNAEAYSRKCPASSWYAFVPYIEKWGASIWIEIRKDDILPNFIPANTLLAQWKKDEAYRHTIMPRIEAAHIGEISTKAFQRVLVSSKKCPILKEYDDNMSIKRC